MFGFGKKVDKAELWEETEETFNKCFDVFDCTGMMYSAGMGSPGAYKTSKNQFFTASNSFRAMNPEYTPVWQLKIVNRRIKSLLKMREFILRSLLTNHDQWGTRFVPEHMKTTTSEVL